MKWWGGKKQMRDEPPAACLHCLYDGGENRTLSAAGGKLYLLGLMRKRWFIRGCSQFQWALAVIRDIAQINPNAQRPRLLRSHSSQHWLSLTLCLRACRVVTMPGLVFFVFHYKASGECHNLKNCRLPFHLRLMCFSEEEVRCWKYSRRWLISSSNYQKLWGDKTYRFISLRAAHTVTWMYSPLLSLTINKCCVTAGSALNVVWFECCRLLIQLLTS